MRVTHYTLVNSQMHLRKFALVYVCVRARVRTRARTRAKGACYNRKKSWSNINEKATRESKQFILFFLTWDLRIFKYFFRY